MNNQTTKQYQCACGKIFDNPQKFNGHKSNCEVHISIKYGKDNQYFINRSSKLSQSSKLWAKENKQAVLDKNLSKRQENYNQWISEQHTCERCGKIMTEKYASGRFCSRSCANKKPHSEESKLKVSNSLKIWYQENPDYYEQNKYYKNSHDKYLQEYYRDPNYCIMCGKVIPYEQRDNKTCSEICRHKRFSQNASQRIEKLGGNIN